MGYKGPESCEVILDEVRVPVENLLGGVEGRGMQQVLSALETGCLNIAASSVGIAARACEEAVNYARSRMAFGKRISEFQAIQLKIADMATDLQAARLLTYWAA
jgi:alkylation response protein AidB-like acyl-CoA dehydrogenase